jgi:hypothetical protein
MEWSGIIVLLAMLFYAWIKVQPSAELYSNTFFGENNQLALISTGIVFGLMNTVMFIFSKLQTEDAEIVRKKEKYPVKFKLEKFWATNLWHIEVWSPRMYDFLVYLILVWQILIAIQGIHNYNNPIEVINAVLPVLVEISLAALVATVLLKIRTRIMQVTTALLAKKEEYRTRYEKRKDDPQWLVILFQELREYLTKDNRWMNTADASTILKVVASEYRRLNAGQAFAEELMGKQAVKEVQSKNSDETKRVPPNGDAEWTIETLRTDFMNREDLRPSDTYTEKRLREDYETADYKARAAYRGGAKDYFTP